MRKILIIALAFSLSGCSTISALQRGVGAAANYTVTQNELDGARNTYDGSVLSTLKSYAALPRCKSGTSLSVSNRCHDRVLLKKMRNADIAVNNAFNATQDQITSGNNTGAVAAYMTLQTAITAIKKIISDNGLV